MPKMKSHSGARKRFKKLKSGLIKFSRSCRRHILTKKTRKRKRHLRENAYIATCDMDHFKKLLPY